MIKLKKEKMKTTIFYLSVLLICISSCTTTYNSYNYSDPNYLKSDEFTSTPVVEEKTIVIVEEYNDVDTISSEENTTINNYYYEDDDGNGYVWPIDKADDENGLTTEEVFKIYWKKYVYSLGNQCLLSDTKNSEIKNIVANIKFWEETFKNSDFLTARSTHDLWSENKPRFWEPAVIEKNSYTYMQAIINFFDPSN